MDRWKSRGGKSRRIGEEERRSEKRKSQKKEDAGVRKGRKVAKHYVFPMFWRSGGSKSRLAKAAGVEPSGHMRDDKLRAAVARSTFRSQNVQGSEHFWKLRCRKVARSTFHFRQMEWRNRKTHWYQLCTQLSIFEGSLAKLLCFRRCQVEKLR